MPGPCMGTSREIVWEKELQSGLVGGTLRGRVLTQPGKERQGRRASRPSSKREHFQQDAKHMELCLK